MGMEEDDEVSRQLAGLYRSRQQIVSDLDVHDVLTELLAGFVITSKDKEYIEYEKSLEDKAEKLLSILEERAAGNGRRPEVIGGFVESLKEKYNWLHQRLTEDVLDSRVIPLEPLQVPGLGARGVDRVFANGVITEDKVFGSLDERRARTIIEAGGVPCLPGANVERPEVLELITPELQKLGRNRYLVLGGMAGSGKSVLAVQAVNNSSLVMQKYSDGVFWLTIGKDCSENKDALLAKMRILCEKLGVAQAPNSFDHGADLLRTAFIAKPNALLVLDDVWRSEVIRAFDVGCRILVTTRDIAVMHVDQARYVLIKVPEGFTEEESMEVFRKVLCVEDDLPHEAKLIHAECKGSPMVISLISSLLQDHDISDEGRWKYYREALSKRKYSKIKKSRTYEHPSVLDAISLSVEGLTSEKKGLYMDFALFQDDVRIPCSVFMTLWQMQKYEVEDIMKDFVRKNLASEDYDQTKKCYMYSINNLLLSYLKYQIAVEQDSSFERESHKIFVERYMDSCNQDFSKLPDDGYIFFYLGYHLYKSKMNNLFPKVYLDLLFIGEKLRITGTADLLHDISKYFDFIAGEEEERRKYVEEIQTFAQLVGHRIYGQLDIDVIQVALQTPHLQRIHTQAKTYALLSGNRLYLEWKNAQSGQWKHPESSVLCADHVTCVKFVGKAGNHFIAGLSNGCIQLCDLESSAVCHNFRGHSDSINSLQVFPSASPLLCSPKLYNPNQEPAYLHIVSASNDKRCKIWDLKPILIEAESKPFEFKLGRNVGASPSPKIRTDQWGFDDSVDESIKQFDHHSAPVTYAQFSQDGQRVVSTSTNEIMIWDSSNGQIVSKISLSFDHNPSLTLQRCLFPPEVSPKYLLCSAENQVILLSADSASNYAGVDAHLTRIVEILFISEDQFCSVSENEIGIWKIEQRKPKAKTTRSRSLSPARSMAIDANRTDSDTVRVRSGANTLDPKDIQLAWKTSTQNEILNCSERNSDQDSPAARSYEFSNRARRESGTISVTIQDSNGVIQALKEDTLPPCKSRSYLCASFAFNGDGRSHLLACGTADHQILLWKLDIRQCIGSFASHNGWVSALDFSSVDQCTLLSGSEDHTVMVWDIEAEEKGTKEPNKLMTFSATYIPDRFDGGYFLSMLFTEKRNTVQIYKNSKKLLETNSTKGPIASVCISKGGMLGIVATTLGDIMHLSLQSKADSSVIGSQSSLSQEFDRTVHLVHSCGSSILCMKFGSSDRYLAAGCENGSLVVLKDLIKRIEIDISDSKVISVDFINDSHVVGISLDSSIGIYNLDNFKQEFLWKSEKTVHITSSAVHGSVTTNPLIAIGTSEQGIAILPLDFAKANSECKSSIAKWIDEKPTSPVRSVAINHGRTKLAGGYDNGMISVWSLESDYPKKEMELILHKSWVHSLQFNHENVGNGQWLVSCGDKIAVWNVDKYVDVKPRRPSFMEERRRRRSGESPVRTNNRLSLEIPVGSKIGRQGKRELLQQFSFRGNVAHTFFTDPFCEKIVTVDDTGVYYLLEVLKGDNQNPKSAKI